MATNNYLYKDARDLREMVDLNDTLKQNYNDDTMMKFPSIVIAGEQSHGKTSLIENITNLNLPRGTGVQTRVPTEIQLRPSTSNNYTIRYKPLGKSDYKVINFTEDNLEEKMRQVQIEVTGSDSEISDETVTLTIERPDLLPLTFIDLPGFVVNRIDDKNDDIEVVMKSLYTKFIADENNTILCVLNAANDIENSQVLKICRQHDPKAARTMICVTKIDLRTSGGYDSYRKAANSMGISRLFFTRNKTEEERAAKIRPEQIREKERSFIESHPELKNFKEEQKGILALRNYLVKLQRTNIIPCLEHNFKRIKEILAEREKEQGEIGKAMEKPSEIRKYIQERLRLIFAEVKELYTNVHFDIISKNYYLKDHNEHDEGVFEVAIKTQRIQMNYKVQKSEEETEIMFENLPTEEMYYEVITDEGQRINGNLSSQSGHVSFRFNKGPFTVSLRVLAAKDFYYYREEVVNLYGKFVQNHEIDYFINPKFDINWGNETKGVNKLNHLPDYDNNNIAEKILFKQIVPKLKSDANQFKEWSKNFVLKIFESRIKHHFENYKNLQSFLIDRVKAHYDQPFLKVDRVMKIICENASKISLTDPMYTFKVESLRKIFEDGNANQPSRFLQAVIEKDIDLPRLKEIYLTNPVVYLNGIRAWAYLTTIFPNLKDNITKTVQNHLIQKPLYDLEFELYSIFDNEFFANKEQVDKYMTANSDLQEKQISNRKEIEKAKKSLELIRKIPKKYPELISDFGFIEDDSFDEDEDLEEEAPPSTSVLNTESTVPSTSKKNWSRDTDIN